MGHNPNELRPVYMIGPLLLLLSGILLMLSGYTRIGLIVTCLPIIGFLYGYFDERFLQARISRKWFENTDFDTCQRQAQAGLPDAQNNLGFLYEKGWGVPQDYVKAHMWYSIAAATHEREDLRDESALNRDMIARRMTSHQIAEAQRRAQEWFKDFREQA